MQQLNNNKILDELKQSKTEEEVKNIYAKYFKIKYNTSNKHDLYTKQVLFEFKYDENFKNPSTIAQTLAQILYYVHKLKFGIHSARKTLNEEPIPPMLCLADRNEAILTETSQWKNFYTNNKYDWDLAPSMPDKKLVNEIANNQLLQNLHIYEISSAIEFSHFSEQLQKYLKNQLSFEPGDKKMITEDNFEDVFEYWNKIFGNFVRNGSKTSYYFVNDIQKDNIITDRLEKENKVFFRGVQSGTWIEKKILAKDYNHFWNLYEKINDANTIKEILAKIDRLTDETMRRFYGDFFTPIPFAKKALKYIERAVGQNWWKSGEYRLWDMAAGTGNLEYHLPQEALEHCYLSTLYKEDREHLSRLFRGSTVFQYDYLNDDIANVLADKMELTFEIPWKLPEKLKKDLTNPNIKWIILINPPFATAGESAGKGSNKEKVSDTQIRKFMHKKNLGEVSRELFSQFLYRIKFEFADKKTYLCLFSKIKYINAHNDQKFRDNIFRCTFIKGFVFSSANFSGTSKKNQFPVGFLIWDLNKSQSLENQKIVLDVFNKEVEKTGQKQIVIENRNNFLNKWIKRPPATIKFPPFSSAIKVGKQNKDKRDRIAKDFLASLMCIGNSLNYQNQTCLLSAPCVSAGALSITPENFEQAMVIHAARRIPKTTWLNDRDQFMKPTHPLSTEFISDCTVWNLFSNSNHTAALCHVEYEGTTYQIHNHFFPFLANEVKQWKITDNNIAFSIAKTQDTFMSKWIRKNNLSSEAQTVLYAGKTIYKFYFAHLNQLCTSKFKIETCDAGWYQIRKSLEDISLCKMELKKLKILHDILKKKILKELRDYKIMSA